MNRKLSKRDLAACLSSSVTMPSAFPYAKVAVCKNFHAAGPHSVVPMFVVVKKKIRMNQASVTAFLLGFLLGGLVTVVIYMLVGKGRYQHRPRHHMLMTDASRHIHELSKVDEVEDLLKRSDPCCVMVHSPHCGHCVAMKANFENAVKELQKPVFVARMDARVAGQEFMKKHEIHGVPHIMGKNSRGELVKYNGDRSKDSLVKFMHDLA